MNDVLEKDQPGLHIEPLQAPGDMEVLIGWTGSPASSSHLVSGVKRLKSGPSFYGDFLDQSHTCIKSLIQAFKTDNIKDVQKMIRINRYIIQSMDDEASIEIEADELKRLCDVGKKHGDASKTSGASGGDCGITVINKVIDKNIIYNGWQMNDIKPLKFKIYHGQ